MQGRAGFQARAAAQPADAALPECERALTAPPPAGDNPASSNQAAAWLLGGALVLVIVLVL